MMATSVMTPAEHKERREILVRYWQAKLVEVRAWLDPTTRGLIEETIREFLYVDKE